VLDNLWNGVDETVRGSFLFRSLDESARHDLVDRGVVMVFAAGREILTEGEDGDDFYLVDRGVVDVVTSVGGSPVALGTLQRGGFFGEVAMLTGQPRTATVRALTEVTVVRFDKADIDDVLDRTPAARRLLETMIAGRARSAAEKITRHLSSLPPGGTDPPTG
jgi:CRP-like cAMP-binding protein